MDGQAQTKQIAFPDSNRIGKFNILHEVLRDGAEREMLQALFGLCIVLEVYENESGRGKTYCAASELFQQLREGEEIPTYRIDVTRAQPFENPDHEARRLNSGAFGIVATRQNIVRAPVAAVVAGGRAPGRFH